MKGWKHKKTSTIIGSEKTPTKMEAGQVIINKKATKKYLDKLIDINNDGLDNTSTKVSTDGTDGGILKGKPHYDKNGNPTGGIPVVVDGGKKIEVEGDEFVVNKEASQKHWKELSKINQSAGNGVPINPSDVGSDEDPEEYRKGGIIQFNPNDLPNSWIYSYAKKVKEKYPKVWDKGGNIFGNEAFKNLERVIKRGYWTENEEWMYIKWRSYVARHKKDYRIAGVIAMLKWVDKVEKGWPYMKDLIEKEIDKKYPKKGWKNKMAEGGGIKIMPQQGTLLTKDKKLKLDYKRNGNDFEFVVYEGENNPVANYTKTSFKKKQNGVVTMDYNQFIDYIYSEGYIDDKNYALGGGVEDKGYEIKGGIVYKNGDRVGSVGSSYKLVNGKNEKEIYFWSDKEQKRYESGFHFQKDAIKFTNDTGELFIDKIKMKTGGVVTYKNKYNKKYGYDKNEAHDLDDISKDTGVSEKGLQQIYNKGVGAYKTNPQSVRPTVKSKEQWAMARVYSAVMGGKAARVDAKELKMQNGGNTVNNACIEELVSLINSYSEIEYWDVDKNKNNLVIVFKNEIGNYDIDIYNKFLKGLSDCETVFDKDVEIKYDNSDYKTIFVKLKTSIENGGAKNIEFMKWFVDWYKTINKQININFSVPNILSPFKEDNVIILDLFEKINQDIDAKPYLNKIIEKADDFGVVIYLEPTPRYKYFLENAEKRKKISKDYLIKYYKNFGFELTQNGQFMKRVPKMKNGGTVKDITCTQCGWAWNKSDSEKHDEYVCHKCGTDNKMKYGGELAKGIKVEAEHQNTFKKVYAHKLTPKQAPVEIAKEHLKEDKNYYSKMSKMEKFDNGGVATQFEIGDIVRGEYFTGVYGNFRVVNPGVDAVEVQNLLTGYKDIKSYNELSLFLKQGSGQAQATPASPQLPKLFKFEIGEEVLDTVSNKKVIIEDRFINKNGFPEYDVTLNGETFSETPEAILEKVVKNITDVVDASDNQSSMPTPNLSTVEVDNPLTYVPSTDNSTWANTFNVGDRVRVRVDFTGDSQYKNVLSGRENTYDKPENIYTIQSFIKDSKPFQLDKRGNNIGGLIRPENPSGRLYTLSNGERWEGKDLELVRATKNKDAINAQPSKKKFVPMDFTPFLNNWVNSNFSNSTSLGKKDVVKETIENYILNVEAVDGNQNITFNKEAEILDKIDNYIN